MRKLLHSLVIPPNSGFQQAAYQMEDVLEDQQDTSGQTDFSAITLKVPRRLPRSQPIKIVLPRTAPGINLRFSPTAFYEPPTSTTAEGSAMLAQVPSPPEIDHLNPLLAARVDEKDDTEAATPEQGTLHFLPVRMTHMVRAITRCTIKRNQRPCQ